MSSEAQRPPADLEDARNFSRERRTGAICHLIISGLSSAYCRSTHSGLLSSSPAKARSCLRQHIRLLLPPHLILLFRNGRQAKLQGFIVFLSKQFEPCQLVSCLMRIERRTFAAPPPLHRTVLCDLDQGDTAESGGWLVNDQNLDLIANFPALLNHRFCKPKVGSSILSTGTRSTT
jgi:hypothetical protein